MKITIVGLGYVGIANLILFSSKYQVIGLDNNQKKVDLLNKNLLLQYGEETINYLSSTKNRWKATTNFNDSYRDSKYIIVCLPTDYDDDNSGLDTSIIDDEIDKINSINSEAVVIIRSTVPIGYCSKLNIKYSNSVISCPEFLREGMILQDSLYPSRIVVGGENNTIDEYIEIVCKCIKNKYSAPIIKSDSNDAEAIKLFSNAYLAMRVAYFNELDMYAEDKNLNSRNIIKGVCADSRIGNFYNNPSFGYGGYCLPKDTRELITEFDTIPHTIIKSIDISNTDRIEYIAKKILNMNIDVIGIYRLTMKSKSDNFRNAAVIQIVNILQENNKEVIVYEPLVEGNQYKGMKVYSSFKDFCEKANIIIANRFSKELGQVRNKVYSRDLFEYN